MPVTLDDHAKEQGSFLVNHTFLDLSGTAVTPSTITWSLSDRDGNIINSREDESYTPSAENFNVVLEGDDLVLGDPDDNIRIVTINAVFTDPTYGAKPYIEEIRFYIDNLVNP